MEKVDRRGITVGCAVRGRPSLSEKGCRGRGGKPADADFDGRVQLGVNFKSSVRGKCYDGEAFRHDGHCDSNRSCNRRRPLHSYEQFLSLHSSESRNWNRVHLGFGMVAEATEWPFPNIMPPPAG